MSIGDDGEDDELLGTMLCSVAVAIDDDDDDDDDNEVVVDVIIVLKMIVVVLSLIVYSIWMIWLFLYYERVNSVLKHYELLQYLSLALASASSELRGC